jgi:hypothetical protein
LILLYRKIWDDKLRVVECSKSRAFQIWMLIPI